MIYSNFHRKNVGICRKCDLSPSMCFAFQFCNIGVISNLKVIFSVNDVIIEKKCISL